MKKSIIASLVALSALAMSNANAADVTFTGAVTAGTCDLVPEVGGAQSNLVNVGTATVSGTATPVDFALTVKDSTSADCNAVTAAGKTADIIWMGQFDANGLENQTGSATGAWLKLTAKNSVTADTEMKGAVTKAEFEADKIAADGAQFQVELNAGATPGDFVSVATFAVAYK